MSLFHSPIGLYGFQADGVARTYFAWSETSEPARLALWDTGIGKTVLSLASVALAFEDDLIDVCVVVAEANKVTDWAKEDAPRFTDLSVAMYHGPKRQRLLDGTTQVLVLSWSTGRNDIGTFRKNGRAIETDGPLLEYLKDKRVAIVFDEFSALRNRTSKTYLAWAHLLRTLRKKREPMILGLTATTIETQPADHWNACRLLSPGRAGSVEDFEPTYVASYDLYGNPVEWKNLTRATLVDPVLPLNEMFGPITLRKRKTDQDVIDQFPSKMENSPTMVDLTPEARSLYDTLEEIFSADDVSDSESRQGFTLLRLLVNHPGALLGSQGQFSKQVVERLGEDRLRAMASAKISAMLAWQQTMGNQQSVIFTFFGQSVLPFIHQALVGEGYSVSSNHGGLSLPERQRAQDIFKAGDSQIFLSSDAGAKGLNLGCGSALLHYEVPLTYATYDQRSNRIHRIDSKHPSVTIDSLVARDTLEYPLAMNTFKRNKMSEMIQDADFDDFAGDPAEGFLRAHDRIALLRRAS